MDTPKRKLIEVGIPLKTINEQSGREKSIHHGHPHTLHLWWARKPLAAARAVLFAQMVDDPSCHPEKFPTEEAVASERARLHALLEQLVVWENSSNENLLAQAHQEILDSTNNVPPPLLDPFAGGGSIPLEAQRLGLEAHASDLNPVAILINKALIEIPPKFVGQRPVSPEVASEELVHTWPRATGLAEDVRRYGEWMRDEAKRRIGHLYPQASLSDRSKATAIAWIWARTVICPNPACGIQLPLVRSWWLSKKTGKEAYVVPSILDGIVTFSIGHDIQTAPTDETDSTVERTGATCIGCGASLELNYIRAEGRSGRMGQQLMAIVAEGQRTRLYLSPTQEHESAAAIERRKDSPEGAMSTNPRSFSTPAFGMTEFSDLFTARQLMTLTTFSDLVIEVRQHVLAAAIAAGMPDGEGLEAGGVGAAAYADAVTTYLGMASSTIADDLSTLVGWRPTNGTGSTRSTFVRQALPMVWNFAEANPFSNSSGDIAYTIAAIVSVLKGLIGAKPAVAIQRDARAAIKSGFAISTDPPYYDNVGHSDLSDFFYIWLRRSLRHVYPTLLSTMLVPKADELVANPHRHDGRESAQTFFEDGFREVFRRARQTAIPDFPVTVYYAFKQSETTDGSQVSTGWEKLLQGMLQAGWSVTATWPLRTERGGRMLSLGKNSLASSILLALRPRPEDAPRTDRRRFVASLKAELPTALKELQQAAIAPVDLPQAAIGPGMAVFSRYAEVLEDDGSAMPVRVALALINEVLDEVLTEQEGDFDPDTRFAIAWFRQFGFDSGPYGDADNIARARNASVDHLDQAGILTSRAGKVTLIAPEDLGADYDPATDPSISSWEVVMHLTRVLAIDGIPAASALLAKAPGSIERDLCKELAFLLFTVAETRKQTKLAVDFNALGTAWNEIAAGASTAASKPVQSTIDFKGN